MFKKYSYKQKNIILGIGFLAFSIIAYYVALSETINLIQRHQMIQDKLIGLEDANDKIQLLENKIQSLNNAIGGQFDNSNFQKALLENTSSFCSNHLLKIDDFPKPILGKIDSYYIETYQITLEGPFHEALEYIYLLENKWRIGKTTSINMESKLDHRTKKNKLYSTVFIQFINSN